MLDVAPIPTPLPALPPDLNEAQARAVAHVNGPLLIFAGAGSGKTRVIVYRVANLVAAHRVPPYRVLAVTFTNKAAGEMRSRLAALLGDDIAKDLWVGTFHAVCVRLLRRHHDAAGLARGFVIYDDGDQRAVMNRVIKELNLDDKRYPPKQVLSIIHAEKQEGRTAADYQPEGFVGRAVAQCFEAYERHLKAANALDFDDILLSILRLVEAPESLAGEDIRRRFSHVLVDEFQDVNQVQYRLVRALSAATKNLCVVGDDDQSIYRWRGADVRIVRGFRRDFPGAEVVKLEQNYRSSGHIVKGALGVIRSAEGREPKELWTQNPDGEPIRVVTADNEHDEAAYVVDQIRTLVGAGTSPRDIAIFYRIHAQSRVLEEVLRAEKIPYQIIGGMRFFERAEVKDLLSYLRVLDNPSSDVDLLRVVNQPSRKIGDTSIDRLVRAADARGVSLYEALSPLPDDIAGPAKKGLAAFRELLDDLRKSAAILNPAALATEVLEKTGYRAMLEAADSAEAEARLQNLQEVIGSIAQYEEEMRGAGEAPVLSGYLERVTLTSDQDTIEDAPKVAMMTVHAAKGLEFAAVFLTGMEEELFPFKGMERRGRDDDEEERRLAYVAVTRARRTLVVTHTARRSIFGQSRYNVPSRFLRDFPAASVVVRATEASRILGGHRADMPRWGDRSEGRWGGDRGDSSPAARPAWRHPQDESTRAMRPSNEPSRAPGERYVERDADTDGGGTDGVFTRGARVEHRAFGLGTVMSCDPGSDPIVTVKFSGHGLKRIKASFLKAR